MFYLIKIEYLSTNSKTYYFGGKKGIRVVQCANPFYGKKYVNKKSADNMCKTLSDMWNNGSIKVSVHYVDEKGNIH